MLKELGIVDPKEIVRQLDEYVIGQDNAKKALSIAAFQRSIRLLQATPGQQSEYPLQKNNVLLLGGTGSGKTYLVKTLAKVLDCPITTYDITGTTSAGYVGGNIEDALIMHLKNTERYLINKLNQEGQQPEKNKKSLGWLDIVNQYGQLGILYIDEFDKAKKIADRGRDINGEAVQQGLLKVLEGSVISFTEREHLNQGFTQFDCSNLLIICGGAFVGLKEILDKRQNDRGIGFNSIVEKPSIESIFTDVKTEDLVEYGFLPEVLGRIPFITTLKDLTESDLIAILKKSKGSILNEYKELFSIFSVDLIFSNDALKEIAKEAIKRNTGARSLRSIVGKIMEAYQYDIFKKHPKKLKITAEIVKNTFKTS